MESFFFRFFSWWYSEVRSLYGEPTLYTCLTLEWPKGVTVSQNGTGILCAFFGGSFVNVMWWGCVIAIIRQKVVCSMVFCLLMWCKMYIGCGHINICYIYILWIWKVFCFVCRIATITMRHRSGVGLYIRFVKI